jgi:hypothetical protein
VKRNRKRSPRVSLVVACSQRKHIAPRPELRLASLDLDPERRVKEWTKRIERVEAPRFHAEELYAGDHWHAATEAFRHVQRYTSAAELWVISAGYGLISGRKLVKSYSATFANGSPDSVWRGVSEGDRQRRLSDWWGGLPHEATLAELLDRHMQRVIVAAGTTYVEALSDELAALMQQQPEVTDRLSIISAGTHHNGFVLPVTGAFRAAVGGTDAALNARVLALLAADAPNHGFSHSAMESVLRDLAQSLPATIRPSGDRLSDREVCREIRALRRWRPEISRTAALRELRARHLACEQGRFASLWASVVG